MSGTAGRLRQGRLQVEMGANAGHGVQSRVFRPIKPIENPMEWFSKGFIGLKTLLCTQWETSFVRVPNVRFGSFALAKRSRSRSSRNFFQYNVLLPRRTVFLLSARNAIIDQDHHQSAKVTRLHYSHPLMHLHRKFWLQSPPDVPGNEYMNVDKDDDANEGEGEGDGPDFILKLDIPGICRSELLVRKEYIRLYEYCDKYLESRRDKQKPPSVVITGQPGIGKSYWVTYALCRRLAEGKPVFWFHSTQRYLFVEEGVFEVPPDYHSTDLKTRVWLLIDTDDSKDGIPDYLAPHETNHLIILCSSPPSARWKPLTGTTLCRVAIMNPWTRGEISQAAVIHGLTSNDPRIDEMYYQYGPTPHICLDFVKHNALFIKVEQDGFRQKEFWHKCQISHSYPRETIFLRTLGAHHTYDQAEASDPTPNRNAKLRESHITKNWRTLKEQGALLAVVYESLAQEILEEKIALKLVPMVQKDSSGSGRGKKFPRWHFNHGDGANQVACATDRHYASRDVHRVYYTPEAQNQVAFDSFMMADGKLYIFQFTIGSDHPIKKGIVPFFSKKVQGVPPRADWHFVFVVPPSVSEICCSQPRDDDSKLLDEMNLFSAVLDCEAE
ncbi:hypothetical protein EDB92DRAFT_1815302 [Lactarius akahatsu]|uniref:Uncharacterized protein n=1 Tax=Lactarius akahatsu TaxID=416441 RepID=A0AAD4LJ71_9AGAM|nr:hypothetical protein EDB92DRAFT_1815302 [Lactarius akahatsu]